MRGRSSERIFECRQGMVDQKSRGKSSKDAQGQNHERVPRLRIGLVFQGFEQHGGLLTSKRKRLTRMPRFPFAVCFDLHDLATITARVEIQIQA